MTERNRRLTLVGALALLGAVVAMDRFGLLGAGSDDSMTEDEAPTARSLYLARAGLAQSQQALLAQAEEWEAAAERARNEWDAVRSGMVVDRTVELAEARFRDLALEALKDLQLAATRVTPLRDRSAKGDRPAAGAEVRTIAMEVKFDAVSQRDVFAAIDRLEGLSLVRTNIASLRVDGPGRIQMPHVITVTLTLQAQAAVGEAA